LIGDHRLICGDSTDPDTYARLLEGAEAQMIFTDPPYNVPIEGHVSGLGKVKHREFAMASGEMSEAEFTTFLATVFQNLAGQDERDHQAQRVGTWQALEQVRPPATGHHRDAQRRLRTGREPGETAGGCLVAQAPAWCAWGRRVSSGGILAAVTAAPITSAERICPLGPLGIPHPISDRNDAHLVKVVLVLR
jgi:DNA modification methylase